LLALIEHLCLRPRFQHVVGNPKVNLVLQFTSVRQRSHPNELQLFLRWACRDVDPSRQCSVQRSTTRLHIWEYARKEGFAIVSKDTDFRERSYLEGAPPKIVWLDVGNAGTKAIEGLLRREHDRIERFVESEESSVLILSLG